MKLLFFFIMLSSALSLNNCKKEKMKNKDEELTLSRRTYIGNQLRIDGYFYKLYNNKINVITFFYRNGLFINCGGLHNNHEDAKSYIEEQFLKNQVHKNSQLAWGVFNIEKNKIITNYWASPKPYTAYFNEGLIINDSTFFIQEMYKIDTHGNKFEITYFDMSNETYHFRQFSPKPDSTNNFIK